MEYAAAVGCRVFIGVQNYLYFDEEGESLHESGLRPLSLEQATLTFPVTLGVRLSIR